MERIKMITKALLLVISVSAMLMCGLIVLQLKWYDIPKWKCIPVMFAIVVSGVFGSQIWFFVENGYFGGRSLYGAVVFSPIVFTVLSKLANIPYGNAMDFVSPSGCLTLALAKIQCLRDGCCQGKILYLDENHFYVRFPSQIIEMITLLIIVVVLMIMSSKNKYRTKIYPWSIIMYGSTRFVLDFMRETTTSYAFGLSIGSFWSVCSVVIGVIILFVIRRKEKRNIESSKE